MITPRKRVSGDLRTLNHSLLNVSSTSVTAAASVTASTTGSAALSLTVEKVE